jgi:hypothetical protein
MLNVSHLIPKHTGAFVSIWHDSWQAIKRDLTISLLIQNKLECSSGDEATLGDIADAAVMREWKWLFVNGCEFNNPISSAT